MSALACPDCGASLSVVQALTFKCTGCGAGYWMRGIELVRSTGESVRGPVAAPRARRPTPRKPVYAVPAPPVKPAPRDPATVGGVRSGLHCPTCRAELLHQPLSTLACPGCGRGFWQRGGELIPEGEHDAVEVPSTQLPRAQARIKKRDD